MERIIMERIIDEKELEKVSGGSEQGGSTIMCPNCGNPIFLKKNGCFGSWNPDVGVCTCGYTVSEKWL